MIGAIVVGCNHSNNPFHFAFQCGFHGFRLAFPASHTTDVRWVQVELASDAAIQTSND